MTLGTALEKFRDVIAKLRDPNGGCPWDLEQTHETLKPYIIEETYEVIDAIDNNRGKLCEELGDVLLQVVLHAQLANEAKQFDLEQVIKQVTEKIVSRHPHVFGDVVAKSSAEVLKNWEQIKKSEKKGKESVLDSIPRAMPALLRAQRMGEKAARLGFDWNDTEGVKAKIQEELAEFLAEPPNSPQAQEEFGDLLFALAQFARKSNYNSEDLLAKACDKFAARFKRLEKRAGERMKDMSLDELESIWQELKD